MATPPLALDGHPVAAAEAVEPLARFRPLPRLFSRIDRIRVREKISRRLGDFLERSGGVEMPGAEFARIQIDGRGMSLDALCDFQEALLKAAAWSLTAEEIGGMNVTRLDRLCRRAHPRLSYAEAVASLQARGLPYAAGDDLDRRAQAALVASHGELPVQVTRIPGLPRMFDAHPLPREGGRVECVDYILPYAGWACRGHLAFADDGSIERAGCGADLGRMLQCFLGLDALEEAWYSENESGD